MTRRQVAVSATLLAAVTALGAVVGRHHPPAPARIGSAAQSSPRPLTGAEQAAIETMCRRLLTVVGELGPGQAIDSERWAAFVTPTLAAQFPAHRTPQPATPAATTQRLTVGSVTVRAGRPVTALILATVTVATPGRPAVRAPEAWVLSLADTAAGWRVAGVTS